MNALYSFFSKYGTAFGFVLGVFVVLIFLISVFVIGPQDSNAFDSGLAEFSHYDAIELEERTPADKAALYSTAIFSPGLWTTRILLMVAFALAIILPLVYVIFNPKSIIKGAIWLAVIAIIFGLAWVLAPDNSQMVMDAVNENGVGDTANTFISAALSTAVWLVIGSFLLAFAMEIWGLIKGS